MLSFSGIPTRELERAVQVLAKAWKEVIIWAYHFRFIQCGDVDFGSTLSLFKVLWRIFGCGYDAGYLWGLSKYCELGHSPACGGLSAYYGGHLRRDGSSVRGGDAFVRGCESLDKEHIAVYIVQGIMTLLKAGNDICRYQRMCISFRQNGWNESLVSARSRVAAIYGRSISSGTQYDDLTSDIHPLNEVILFPLP